MQFIELSTYPSRLAHIKANISSNFFKTSKGPRFLKTRKEAKMEESSHTSNGQEMVDDFSAISLRPLDLSDIDDFMVWATDDKVSHFCSWDTFTSKEDGINYIKNFIIPHPWFRAICIKDRPIGAISVIACAGDKCRAELGYVLAAKYWGKGIATRAVKMVAATIFSECPHLKRLEARVDVNNLGSQKVLEKAGFLREGVLIKNFITKGRAIDLVVFSLLSTDPKD